MRNYPILLYLSIIILCGCGRHSADTNYKTIDGFAQGSTYHIVYEQTEEMKRDGRFQMEDSLSKYFNTLDYTLSGYNKESLLSRINRGEELPLNEPFLEIYRESLRFFRESAGKVDVSGGPLYDLWGFGFKNGLPFKNISQSGIDSIMQFIGMEKLSLAVAGEDGLHTIDPDSALFSLSPVYLQKQDPRMILNFNAIAQGYTCDYIARRLDSAGIRNYLIEVGGEVYAKGVNARGELWKIGIDKPADGNYIPGENFQEIIRISDRGLVTSGNYRKFYIENGKKYSHTIDPETGVPVQHNLLCATVIADNATIADAYATYFMVVGLDRAKEILAGRPDLEAYLVYGDQEEMKVYHTPGLKEYLTNSR